MFTGLVADKGRVGAVDRGADGARIRVETTLAAELAEGDSVAVNGACLTATEVGEREFAADAMHQTLSLTTIGDLAAGDEVNIELPLRAGDRLGGHIVQGHVDGVGTIGSVSEDGFARRVAIELPDDLAPLVVERGSLAVEGVSLTVAVIDGTTAEVSLIPETLERTTLGSLGEGDRVNVECDVLARYVRKAIGGVTPFAEERSD